MPSSAVSVLSFTSWIVIVYVAANRPAIPVRRLLTGVLNTALPSIANDLLPGNAN